MFYKKGFQVSAGAIIFVVITCVTVHLIGRYYSATMKSMFLKSTSYYDFRLKWIPPVRWTSSATIRGEE